jgi:hypothetical protein
MAQKYRPMHISSIIPEQALQAGITGQLSSLDGTNEPTSSLRDFTRIVVSDYRHNTTCIRCGYRPFRHQSGR